MNWWKRLKSLLQARLAPVNVVDVGKVNDGLVPVSSGTEIDKPWRELLDELNDAREAWRKNPMARRVISLITSYVVGPGITLSSEYGPLQKFIMAFWTHRQNRMDMRCESWCDELSRSGELFLVLFTNPADGMSYVRAIPASRIEEVDYRDGDYETELRFRESTGPGEEDKWWLGAAHPSASVVGADGGLPPVMLHFAVNRPVGAIRGESDLASILPWLRRYNRWLEDRVRLNAAVRSFLWIVYAAGRLKTEVQEKYRKPPEAGTVIVAEEGAEKWEAVAPTLHAQDAEADGRAIRWMIASGGPGTSLVDFGESEDANLATARATAEQRRRFLLRRQSYFGYILGSLVLVAYERWALSSSRRVSPKTLEDILVHVPDISTEDNDNLAGAVSALVGGLNGLRAFLGDSEALKRMGLRLFVKFSGDTVTESEFEQMLTGRPVRYEE